MSRYICKLDDKYFEWSDIVDAPVTLGMTREQFIEYYREEYGRREMYDLGERLARADKNGTSSLMGEKSFEEMIVGNRAGPGEREATVEEIRAMINAPVE